MKQEGQEGTGHRAGDRGCREKWPYSGHLEGRTDMIVDFLKIKGFILSSSLLLIYKAFYMFGCIKSTQEPTQQSSWYLRLGQKLNVCLFNWLMLYVCSDWLHKTFSIKYGMCFTIFIHMPFHFFLLFSLCHLISLLFSKTYDSHVSIYNPGFTNTINTRYLSKSGLFYSIGSSPVTCIYQ